MSEAAVSFDLEHLEPSEPPGDAAERLLAAARAEAAEIAEQARREGFEQGRAAGVAAAENQVRTASDALTSALAQVQRMRGDLADQVEREAVELALALAGKIVLSTLQIRPELVVETLQGALRRVSGERTVAIVVNPADAEIVRSALGELRSQSAAEGGWDLQTDQRVPAGGAILRTDESEVDARIQTQLDRAHEAVEAEIGPRRSR